MNTIRWTLHPSEARPWLRQVTLGPQWAECKKCGTYTLHTNTRHGGRCGRCDDPR